MMSSVALSQICQCFCPSRFVFRPASVAVDRLIPLLIVEYSYCPMTTAVRNDPLSPLRFRSLAALYRTHTLLFAKS